IPESGRCRPDRNRWPRRHRKPIRGRRGLRAGQLPHDAAIDVGTDPGAAFRRPSREARPEAEGSSRSVPTRNAEERRQQTVNLWRHAIMKTTLWAAALTTLSFVVSP